MNELTSKVPADAHEEGDEEDRENDPGANLGIQQEIVHLFE